MPKPKKSHKKKNFWKRFLFAFGGFIIVFVILSPWSDFNPKWSEPPRFVSHDGKLTTTLDAGEGIIDGRKVKTYNGFYPGPVFEMKGGDTFQVHLENNLKEITNLHFHGSHVSPRGNSDNVLVTIEPGETFDYEYHLPSNHPPGLYWYHPHAHPYVEGQVGGGMAGAIIVRGDIDELPGIKDVPEKLLVLTTQDGDDPNNPVRLVNGREMPALYIRPGQIQRWRILNASADDYYNFSLPGQKLRIISRDGNTLSRVVEEENEVMAPGDRIEILVQGGIWGTYDVDSLPFVQGFAHYEKATFMRLVVAGFPTWPKEFPTTLLPFDDLRNVKVDHTRTLTFSMGGTDDNPEFLLDGREFNPNVVNQLMTLGATEEWKLVNESNETHPFHIHINPFQVISINGKPVDRNGYDDTFSIPRKSTVVIRTQYKDFDGKYVLHCHILFHEDHGMMQIVEVVRPGFGQTVDNGMPEREKIMQLMDHDREMMHGENRYTKWK